MDIEIPEVGQSRSHILANIIYEMTFFFHILIMCFFNGSFKVKRNRTRPVAAFRCDLIFSGALKIEHSVLSVVVMVTDYPGNCLVLRTCEGELVVIVIDPRIDSHQQVQEN